MVNHCVALAPGFAPLAAELRLSPEEVDSVRRNGFIRAKRRGRQGVVFQLHFRSQGRQFSRYLGADRQHADRIQMALDALQRGTHAERRLRKRTRQIRALLARLKPQLAAHLPSGEYYFHGRILRRRRKPRPDNTKSFGRFHSSQS
jgi:hypothetical protein